MYRPKSLDLIDQLSKEIEGLVNENSVLKKHSKDLEGRILFLLGENDRLKALLGERSRKPREQVVIKRGVGWILEGEKVVDVSLMKRVLVELRREKERVAKNGDVCCYLSLAEEMTCISTFSGFYALLGDSQLLYLNLRSERMEEKKRGIVVRDRGMVAITKSAVYTITDSIRMWDVRRREVVGWAELKEEVVALGTGKELFLATRDEVRSWDGVRMLSLHKTMGQYSIISMAVGDGRIFLGTDDKRVVVVGEAVDILNVDLSPRCIAVDENGGYLAICDESLVVGRVRGGELEIVYGPVCMRTSINGVLFFKSVLLAVCDVLWIIDFVNNKSSCLKTGGIEGICCSNEGVVTYGKDGFLRFWSCKI